MEAVVTERVWEGHSPHPKHKPVTVAMVDAGGVGERGEHVPLHRKRRWRRRHWS